MFLGILKMLMKEHHDSNGKCYQFYNQSVTNGRIIEQNILIKKWPLLKIIDLEIMNLKQNFAM